MVTRKKIRKIKLNKKYSSLGGVSIKVLGMTIVLILVFVGVILAQKGKVNRSLTDRMGNSSKSQNQGTVQNENQPASTTGPVASVLPSTLQVELPQNKKTAKVEKNSFNQQEIIFYSSSSADDIIAFYKKWAPAHNFVFLPETQSLAQSERIAFSLVPGFGANGLYTHYFTLEPKESEVRVILSYSDAAPTQK